MQGGFGVQRISMTFDARGADAPFRDLSAGARVGDTLFVAGDEGASIEALAPGSRKTWRQTASYRLDKLIDLPGGTRDEIDIEGIAAEGGWLWVTGSHALTRPKPNGDGPKALRSMSKLKRSANRYLLARFPLVDAGNRQFEIAAKACDREAGRLEAGKRSSALIKWIEDDSLLSPFVGLAAKENGFDIEGLAVHGDTVWAGLRGPVMRGHAVLLQFELRAGRGCLLKARKTEGRRYRRYLLDLGGLAVRDLMTNGKDLLILAGPAMTAGNVFRVVRWKGAASASASAVVPEGDLKIEKELTVDPDLGRPEAIIGWKDGQVLVLRDGAPVLRRGKKLTVTANVLDLND